MCLADCFGSGKEHSEGVGVVVLVVLAGLAGFAADYPPAERLAELSGGQCAPGRSASGTTQPT